MTVYELLKRKKPLERIIVRLKTDLKNLPEGRLLIKHYSYRQDQFYNSLTTAGKPQYLSINSDKALITKLAKKTYMLKALKSAETEHKLLTGLLNHETKNSLSQIYDNTDSAIKPFIKILLKFPFRKR